MTLNDVETPALVLDRGVLERNLGHMRERARTLGVTLRPHVKTAKSAAVTMHAHGGMRGPVTVSTLGEAEYFLAHGFEDIIYAVGIEPSKLPHVKTLGDKGGNITVLLDHPATARMLEAEGERLKTRFQALLEIDSGCHRGGMPRNDPRILETAAFMHQSARIEFRGVLTHAGCSYDARSIEEIVRIAETERAAVVDAADAIEAKGIPCPVRSVGSTPTAMFAQDLNGVTEMRPGVYMLMDLYQQGLGVCGPGDLAVSVLSSVIGRRDDMGYVLIDAGALALSQDVSAARIFAGETLYGQLRDRQGQLVLDDLRIDTVNQEHGWIRPSDNGFLPEDLVPGDRVRIFPNHACMMAAPYHRFHVVEGGDEVVETWNKTQGW